MVGRHKGYHWFSLVISMFTVANFEVGQGDRKLKISKIALTDLSRYPRRGLSQILGSWKQLSFEINSHIGPTLDFHLQPSIY